MTPKLDTHSLKFRLLAWILLVFLLYIALFTTLTVLTDRWMSGNIVESSLGNVEQTGRLLSYLLQKAQEIGFVISTSDNLNDLANYNPAIDTSFYDKVMLVDKVTREIMLQAEMNSEISTVYVYVDRTHEMITSNMAYYSRQYFFPEFGWLEYTQDASEAFAWVGHLHDKGLTEHDYVSLMCRADIINRDIRSPTYVCINIDETRIHELLSALELIRGSRVFLLDESYRIISTSAKEHLGEHVSSAVGWWPVQKESNRHQLSEVQNDSRHLAVVTRLKDVGWHILVLLPKKELFAEPKRILIIMILSVMTISAVLFILTSRTLIHQVNMPIATMAAAMRRAENGEFGAVIPEHRRDEFGYLYSSYNSMVGRIEQLIGELYHEKLLKKEVELKFLQRQINPHFLYNTMDTINWIAKKHGVTEISQIVRSLSQLYRSIFNKGNDYISIRDMLTAIESFLYIQKYRYRNLSRYTCRIDNELDECLILNLIVQPIVENAVIHGIADHDIDGCIDIEAIEQDNDIVIRVMDNGAGMDSEKLERIQKSLSSDNDISSASGLHNVAKRIELVYGTPYGLRITSTLQAGTTVEVRVPKRRAGEQAQSPTG